jgi:hypothetical protein
MRIRNKWARTDFGIQKLAMLGKDGLFGLPQITWEMRASP